MQRWLRIEKRYDADNKRWERKYHIVYPKVDYTGTGRKAYPLTLHIGLEHLRGNKEPYFSIQGTIGSPNGRGLVSAGAGCEFKFREFFSDDGLMQTVLENDENWHLRMGKHIPASALSFLEYLEAKYQEQGEKEGST